MIGKKSQSKIYDVLKDVLHAADNEKTERVVSANQAKFQMIFSCFHNYEVSKYVCTCICKYICKCVYTRAQINNDFSIQIITNEIFEYSFFGICVYQA